MKLLIIQQKMIGDVLTTSSLFEVIKQQFPDAILHYVVNQHTVPVIQNNPHIDALKIVTPEVESSIFKTIAFAKSLRKEHYDAVVDIYGLYCSNIISLFCGAKRKISKRKWYTQFIYSDLIKELKQPTISAGLAIENRLLYIKPLGIKPNALKPQIYLTEKEIKDTALFLKQSDIDVEQPLCMIGVLGSDETKTYPFKYMANVLDTIVKTKPNAQLLFNYIPKQLEDAKAIFNLCLPETQAQIKLDVFGKSLRDFMCITHFCDALIGNEGGAINMAKALNVKTFTIFSPWIKKEVWSLFEDDITNVSVHLKDYNPEVIKASASPKKDYEQLYLEFKSTFYTEKLKRFLN